jgi:phenylalanyl-tRNA synthetase beta chain
MAIGLRPINNVVDITNFVMLETGQPLHAFDFHKISGSRIIVRKARPDEKIVTLDGQERQLDPEMLMICDEQKPVAVAGVMGGANSEVEADSSEILLESACFDPVCVRRTARKLNLGTDASFRFERGVDPQGAPYALERVVRLMVEICGARPVADGFDVCAPSKEVQPLKLRVQRTSDLLGVDFDSAELSAFLTAIEFKVRELDSDTLEVIAPSFRVDIEREIDLVEEIARLKGYNEIPTTLPVVPMRFSEQDSKRLLRQQLTTIMTSLGFSQAINYSFTAEKHFDLLGLSEDDSRRQTVRLLNPLAEEQNVMRTTLLPGLLENVRRNVNHQVSDVQLFEIGKVFHPVADELLPEEKFHLTVVLSGRRQAGAPVIHFGQQPSDIFDIKGVAETIFQELRLSRVKLVPSADSESYCEAGTLLDCRQGDVLLGRCGRLSRSVMKTFALRQDVFFLDIDFELLARLDQTPRNFVPLPKFPVVRWDIAVLVPDSVGGGDMLRAIYDSNEPLLEQAEIFDVYQGDPIEKGKKSVAVSLSYRSNEGTLDDDTVGVVHQKMIDLLLSRFDGQLREV